MTITESLRRLYLPERWGDVEVSTQVRDGYAKVGYSPDLLPTPLSFTEGTSQSLLLLATHRRELPVSARSAQ